MAKIERVDRGLYRVENNDGSISWQIDYLNPDRKRIRKTFSTKKQAAEERAARVHMMAKGEYGEFVEKKEKKSATLGELLELYRKNYQDQTSFKTAKKFYIQGFREYFKEDTLLSSIEYGDLKTYRNTLKKSLNQHGKILSFSSVNAKMSCLRHMFKEAIEYKMIEQSPFNGGKTLMLKVDNVRERYLEPEEINRLLDKSPLHLQHIIKCGLFSGMRLGNILSLKWSQIRDGHMYVKTKTGKDNFPVSDILAELFEQIKGSQKPVNGNVVDLNGKPVERAGIKSEYVFTYQGEPVKSVKTAFKKACEEAGLEYGRDKADGVTFHTLRHTYGTYLAKQGTHIRTIQELLGHKNIKMTQRYTKVADDSKRQAVNGLNYDL
jgi:integrase